MIQEKNKYKPVKDLESFFSLSASELTTALKLEKHRRKNAVRNIVEYRYLTGDCNITHYMDYVLHGPVICLLSVKFQVWCRNA